MAVIRYTVAYEYNELCNYNLTVHGPVRVQQNLDLGNEYIFHEFTLNFSYFISILYLLNYVCHSKCYCHIMLFFSNNG
jgi:hypothetical protein